MTEPIRSSQNKFFKFIKSLELKKHRDDENCFIVEGEKFVCDIPEDQKIQTIAVSESYFAKNKQVFNKTADNFVLFSNELFEKLSDVVQSQGVLAVCEKKQSATHLESGVFLLLDEISDPGNLGTIIRTAAAGGVDKIYISKHSADIYSPKVLRATASSVFFTSFETDVDLAKIIIELKSCGVNVFGTDLNAEKYHYDEDFRGKIAFLIGNESRGVHPKLLDLCNKKIKIPMSPNVDSLNANVAAAVLIYEAVRQKKGR